MENYRKIYEEACNIKIPKSYEIHHIDSNRENNMLSNLVMLPKELHNKYHLLLDEYKRSQSCKIDFLITGNRLCTETYISNLLKQLLETLEECNKWCDYKYYLLHMLPNIHNIEVHYE